MKILTRDATPTLSPALIEARLIAAFRLADRDEIFDRTDPQPIESLGEVVDKGGLAKTGFGFYLFTPPKRQRLRRVAKVDPTAKTHFDRDDNGLLDHRHHWTVVDPDGREFTDNEGVAPEGFDAYEPEIDDEQIELQRKAMNKRVRHDPTWWRTICVAHEDQIVREPVQCNAELIMHEAFDWIVEVEGKPKDERARQIVLCWLRWGCKVRADVRAEIEAALKAPCGRKSLEMQARDSARAFCRAKGILPNSLRHAINTYCRAVADRLARLGITPLSAEWVTYANPDIVYDLDEISHKLGRSWPKTWRLIAAGKLPVGEIGGRPCASLKMLHPYRARQSAVATAAAAVARHPPQTFALAA
jgi:hypothetical protein